MKIGFGAPVAGAWATPGYLAAFSEQKHYLSTVTNNSTAKHMIFDPHLSDP